MKNIYALLAVIVWGTFTCSAMESKRLVLQDNEVQITTSAMEGTKAIVLKDATVEVTQEKLDLLKKVVGEAFKRSLEALDGEPLELPGICKKVFDVIVSRLPYLQEGNDGNLKAFLGDDDLLTEVIMAGDFLGIEGLGRAEWPDLLTAVASGKKHIVDSLLLLNPEAVENQKNEALFCAVEHQFEELVALLINFGADVNYSATCPPKEIDERFGRGSPPYVYDTCTIETKQYYPPYSPIYTVYFCKTSVLTEAASRPNSAIVKLLLDGIAEEYSNLSALRWAIENGHTENVCLLYDFDRSSQKGEKALEYALSSDRPLIAKLLLDKGAADSISYDLRRKLLFGAAEKGYKAFIKNLFRISIVPGFKEDDQEAALSKSLKFKQISTVKTLLSENVSADYSYLLNWSVTNSSTELIDWILEQKKVSESTVKETLMKAVAEDNVLVVAALKKGIKDQMFLQKLQQEEDPAEGMIEQPLDDSSSEDQILEDGNNNNNDAAISSQSASWLSKVFNLRNGVILGSIAFVGTFLYKKLIPSAHAKVVESAQDAKETNE